MRQIIKKKGQIWVETVIYTLIGLAIIASLIAVIKPTIEQKKDQILIEQSLEMINEIDAKIEDIIYYGIGNSRQLLIDLKKGTLTIDPLTDVVTFFMKSGHMYSEPGEDIKLGRVVARTEDKGSHYEITFTMNYSERNMDLKWGESDGGIKSFQPAPTPHRISILFDDTRTENKDTEFEKTFLILKFTSL